MKFSWTKVLGLMLILTFISSVQVTAQVAASEVQVDEQTRQRLEQKYDLSPPEEPEIQDHFFSGDWGMSFRYNSEREPLDKLMQAVPFSLWPMVWIFRILV